MMSTAKDAPSAGERAAAILREALAAAERRGPDPMPPGSPAVSVTHEYYDLACLARTHVPRLIAALDTTRADLATVREEISATWQALDRDKPARVGLRESGDSLAFVVGQLASDYCDLAHHYGRLRDALTAANVERVAARQALLEWPVLDETIEISWANGSGHYAGAAHNAPLRALIGWTVLRLAETEAAAADARADRDALRARCEALAQQVVAIGAERDAAECDVATLRAWKDDAIAVLTEHDDLARRWDALRRVIDGR